MSNQFPDQMVPESEKLKPSWGKQHLDYAEFLLVRRNNILANINLLYQSYNGVKTNKWWRSVNHTHGLKNRAELMSYRLCRNKLDLLNGEWLKRPLKATVETVNQDAKSSKMEQADFLMGAMLAKESLNSLKEVGVDVTQGMQIPQDENDPYWETMSYKDKNEEIMQIIVDNAIKELSLQEKTAHNFRDLEICSLLYGKVDISDEGDLNYIVIDPRDAIFAEMENDKFLERSPIKGARFRMTISEITRKYSLKHDQLELLKQLQNQPPKYINGKNYRPYSIINGDLCVDVIHIEWKSSRPEYYKLSPKTLRQIEFDPSTTYYTIPLEPEAYESNKDKYVLVELKSDTVVEDILKDIPRGKVAVIRKFKEDLWEATRIGGIIDTQVRRKYWQIRKQDNKAYVLDMSYVGYSHQMVDGIRISLQQVIEPFDNMFDIVMYQILKELNSSKGRVLFIDSGILPSKKSTKEAVYDMVNDGFLIVDSSADGKTLREGIDVTKFVTKHDLGFSENFQQLLVLKDQIIQTVSLITGINENREGYTAASETATSAQNNIAASRTITEPLFYGMGLFTEKLLMKIAEAYKIIYAFYKIDKGEQILGSNRQGFLTIMKSIGYQDYDVYIQDGGRYAEIKQKLEGYMNVALQNREIHMLDAIMAESAETYSEFRSVFKNALERTQKIASEQAAQEQQAQAALAEQQAQAQADMLDRQQDKKTEGDLIKIKAKGQVDMALQNQKDINKLQIDQNKHDNEAIIKK